MVTSNQIFSFAMENDKQSVTILLKMQSDPNVWVNGERKIPWSYSSLAENLPSRQSGMEQTSYEIVDKTKDVILLY